ncbi:MAG: flippase-like domain-containing protein [Bacteroidales bacterium]|nr:flippase-like domain-containing protein [Bacteroidales bacterium]
MKVSLKDIVKYLLTIGITVLLLWFAFRGISWDDMMDGFARCNWWWIAASMAVGWAVVVSRGCRWRLMMQPISAELTRLECYDAYNVCYLANLAVPRSGELVRCAMLARTGKISFQQAAGSMALERTWDLLSAFLIGLGMVLFTRFGTFLLDDMWKPFAESLSFNAVWLVVGLCALLGVSIWAIFHFRNRYAFVRKIWDFLAGLGGGIRAGFAMKHKIPFFLHTVFIWVMYWLQVLFVIYAFPDMQQLNASDAFFVMMVGSLGWIVPVQGGFGAYHFLVAMALVPVYGIEQHTGLIFATISHESQILQMLVCGIVSLITFFLIWGRRRNLL